MIKTKSIYGNSIAFILLMFLTLVSCVSESNDSDSGLIKIALREAGNQLLLQQKDSTSIILPIIELEKNAYQLAFESPIKFEPNTLVKVIDSSFTIARLSQNYRVEVTPCLSSEVAYSYEMHIEQERTIIPCAGRYLPESCYTVQVQFLNSTDGVITKQLLRYGLLIGILGFLVYYFRRKPTAPIAPKAEISTYSEIGSFHFYPEQNKLVKAAKEISLSKKECELLELFVAHPNQVIKRDELTKKVWEDHGVFVGRSLDTYISKLRKKLKDDERIKLTNVHGVGYKLEFTN